MTLVASGRITPQDLLRRSDSNTLELVAGKIVEKTSSIQSCEVEGFLFFCIHRFFVDHAVAEVYPGTLGYQCFPDEPDKIRKPDASVIRIDRVRALTNPNAGYVPIVPDLAVEVMRRFRNISTPDSPWSGWRIPKHAR